MCANTDETIVEVCDTPCPVSGTWNMPAPTHDRPTGKLFNTKRLCVSRVAVGACAPKAATSARKFEKVAFSL
eukprot:897294-Prymnesium_polylepis.1